MIEAPSCEFIIPVFAQSRTIHAQETIARAGGLRRSPDRTLLVDPHGYRHILNDVDVLGALELFGAVFEDIRL